MPQTMLGNGGLESADGHNLNLMAAAVFHYKFGLRILGHLIPILDVSGDGIFDLTDYNMVAANPNLMGCNPEISKTCQDTNLISGHLLLKRGLF